MPRSIDLNADLGEGNGPCRLRFDREILPLVTSANVACGFHAGDPHLIASLVREAREAGVTVGAHPGYPDRLGFGRREMASTAGEIATEVVYQVGAFGAIAKAGGWAMRYVKPHGALYHRLVQDPAAAGAVVEALASIDHSLVVLTQPGGALANAAERGGLPVAFEAFLDRGYEQNGTLVPRGAPGALLEDTQLIADRAERLALDGMIKTHDGTSLQLTAHSCCVHGDGPEARAILEAVRDRFAQRGIPVCPFAP